MNDAVTNGREFWTVGTRDFRNFLTVELTTHEAATHYREEACLDAWVVVSVVETEAGRAYSSPELPDGPLRVPSPGNF